MDSGLKMFQVLNWLYVLFPLPSVYPVNCNPKVSFRFFVPVDGRSPADGGPGFRCAAGRNYFGAALSRYRRFTEIHIFPCI